MVFDYPVRQKVPGTHVNSFLLKQLPVLAPEAYQVPDLLFVVPPVVELVYTGWDVKALADDLWREGDGALQEALRWQWEANRAATGGHG
jgi:hypothetical protein